MDNPTRDVRVTLGNKSYSLRTTLNAEELERLERFSGQVLDALKGVQDQERKLVLGWMLMAYELDKAEQSLRTLLLSLEKSPKE